MLRNDESSIGGDGEADGKQKGIWLGLPWNSLLVSKWEPSVWSLPFLQFVNLARPSTWAEPSFAFFFESIASWLSVGEHMAHGRDDAFVGCLMFS